MDAHEREAAAAAQGMVDVYGCTPDPFANIAADDGGAIDAFCGAPPDLPAVGDWVNGITAGRRWSGYVLSAEPGRLAVECDGAWIVVHPSDITRA